MASLIAWVCLRFIAFSHSNLNNVCINSNISNFAEKTELTIEDKYKKTMQEIGILKDELGNDVLFLSQVNQCHSIYPLPLPLASPWPKGRSLVISEWMCWSTSSDLASYCEVYSSKWSFVWKEEGIFFLRGSSLQHFSLLLDANKINNTIVIGLWLLLDIWGQSIFDISVFSSWCKNLSQLPSCIGFNFL